MNQKHLIFALAIWTGLIFSGVAVSDDDGHRGKRKNKAVTVKGTVHAILDEPVEIEGQVTVDTSVPLQVIVTNPVDT
jgi:hypothetical protein